MDSSTPHATAPHVPDAALTAGDNDYHKGLSSRQMQMIAMGGAIGTGLFMGAGADWPMPDRASWSATQSAAFLPS